MGYFLGSLRLILVFTVLVLLAVLPSVSFLPVRQVHASLASDVSVVYVDPLPAKCCSPAGPTFFVIKVMLNLAQGQSMNEFDVKMNYTFGGPSYGIKAVSVDNSNNIFTPYSNTTLLDCIDGVAQLRGVTSCTRDDILPGQVHFAEAILGTTVTGPITGLLFSIKFNVTGTNPSLFTFDRVSLFNPGSDLGNPRISYLPVWARAGVFGSLGVVAFFDFEPDRTVDPPAILPNSNLVFDAHGSFSADAIPISNYTWDFPGGPHVTQDGSAINHNFTSPGRYLVQLIVKDSRGGSGYVSRTVVVQPALGSLRLAVKDKTGSPLDRTVVRLFNSTSSPSAFTNKTSDSTGTVVFDSLQPGLYYLRFSGVNIVDSPVTEKVSPGWLTLDTVYLKVDIPPTPQNYGDAIFVASLAAFLGLLTVGIVLRRRRSQRRLGTNSGSRRRNADSSRRSSRNR
jgi:PKD repeat protein